MEKRYRLFALYISATVVYCIISAILVNCYWTDWMMAKGSDSLTAIYRLTMVQQIVALSLAPVIIYISIHSNLLKSTLFRIPLRVGLFLTSILLFFLAFNALTINGKNDTVAQIWVVLHYNKLPYTGPDFPEGRIHVKGIPPFLIFSNDAGKSETIFLGIPPFHLDKEAIYGDPMVDRSNK